jgi:hypothetical protein
MPEAVNDTLFNRAACFAANGRYLGLCRCHYFNRAPSYKYHSIGFNQHAQPIAYPYGQPYRHSDIYPHAHKNPNHRANKHTNGHAYAIAQPYPGTGFVADYRGWVLRSARIFARWQAGDFYRQAQ